MPPIHEIRCPSRRRTRPLVLLLLLCVALAVAPAARADGCDGCPAPTLTDLQQVPGFKLENRKTWWGGISPDHYYLDKGECSGAMTGMPEVTIEESWLVLRGTGEVWNCPHSKSTDTITVESSASDSTEWSFSVTLGSEVGPVGASFKREVEMGNTTGTTVTEVTRISKSITPTYCHRIQWKAYFEVARVKATGNFSFKQRWAWWTKNTATGPSQVHASGEVWVDCGSGTLELSRKAPIAGHFDLSQRGCSSPECAFVVAKPLGVYPPWPTPPDAPDEDDDEPSGSDAPASDADPQPPEAPTPSEADEPDGPEPDAPQSSSDLGEAPTGAIADPQGPNP